MKKNFTLFLSFLFVFVGCKQAPDKFTITYHTEHGETPSSLIVEDGYLLTSDDLPTLSEDGYTFNGWDKAVGDEITEDTDITASWTKNPPTPVPNPKIKITYVSDHGTLPKKDPVDKGYKLTTDDLPTLSEDGYAFKGWDKTVGDELTADTTITALWIKTWKITYTSNKSELKDKLPATKTVEEGYKLTADDLKSLSADGYNFKNWDKSADLEIKADVTITATWAKLYKITYYATENTSLLPQSKTVEEGYELLAADLPNLEIGFDTESEDDDSYCNWNKAVGDVISDDTSISGTWEKIVCLKNFESISSITSGKMAIEKIVFTMEAYTGSSSTIDCADSTVDAGYFKGVLTNGTEPGQKILTVYGNGHRIYAPVDCSSLFSGYTKLTEIDFNNFYTSKTEKMYSMFYDSNELVVLDISNFDTSNVTNMSSMFKNCSALTSLNVSSFDTSKVTNMKEMFNGCAKLTELDVSSFDTSSVLWTSMGGCGLSIFNGCSSLVTIYASDKFVSTLPTLTIFDGCTSLVGGAGTKYSDAENKTAAYAHIDGGTANPGYFTLKQ